MGAWPTAGDLFSRQTSFSEAPLWDETAMPRCPWPQAPAACVTRGDLGQRRGLRLSSTVRAGSSQGLPCCGSGRWHLAVERPWAAAARCPDGVPPSFIDEGMKRDSGQPMWPLLLETCGCSPVADGLLSFQMYIALSSVHALTLCGLQFVSCVRGQWTGESRPVSPSRKRVPLGKVGRAERTNVPVRS